MYEFVSLNLKCPKCGELLMDTEHLVDNEASIKLNIQNGGNKGLIHLSSIYGSYNYSCDIEIPAGEIATFSCTHCNEVLNSKSECLTCGAEMVPFYLDMGGKVSICSRSGCKNHHVEFEDLSHALRKLYQEYGFRGRKYPNDERTKEQKRKLWKRKKMNERRSLKQDHFFKAIVRIAVKV